MKTVIRNIKLFEMRSCRQILTRRSVQKYYPLAVLLLEITVNYGITEKRNYKPSLNEKVKRELKTIFLKGL